MQKQLKIAVLLMLLIYEIVSYKGGRGGGGLNQIDQYVFFSNLVQRDHFVGRNRHVLLGRSGRSFSVFLHLQINGE